MTCVWADARAVEADLATAARTGTCLRVWPSALKAGAWVLRAEQVYDFEVPPVLGGALEVDNVQTIDFVVGLHIAGQFHDQIRGLPPGTRISGFTLSDETT